jgi:drug/metabolite transporter (DMT)-like permease
LMLVGGGAAWAATTLIIKVSSLNRVSAEKTLLYQLVVSVPLLALSALIFGEHIDATPSPVALGAFAYTVLVVSLTFAIWFVLIVRYSAARLSVFTFLAPLFGVASGHFILGDPLTPPFALAVIAVALGILLVNRPR